MRKVSIVLLNYLNYIDTIACVDSILEMNYEIEGIVIVDNHSNNDSFKILYKKYENKDKIIVVKSGKNYGYAKGNNIGIHIARSRFQTDFVFIANNDTIFTEEDFFMKLLDNYTEGIGVIGPAIRTKRNIIQRRYTRYVTLRENIILYMRDFLQAHQKDSVADFFIIPNTKSKIMVLHGCALLLTPSFFQYYKGFYERTFLYNEELILYFMCKRYDLEQKYVKDTYIYHKEDKSSQMSFHNDNAVMHSYKLQSRKYVLWWIIKDKFK